MGEHSYISCSGCGGRHPRPGGSLCKILQSGKLFTGEDFDEIERKEEAEGATNTGSQGVPWSEIVAPDELREVPDREDPQYLEYCEKTIQLLKARVETTMESEKVIKAESTISKLLAQLHVGTGTKGKNRRLSSPAKPPPSWISAPVAAGHTYTSTPSCLKVVEETDTRDYLSKLRPEQHLTPKKQYEAMNFREMVLGMACVHNHLVQHGRPTIGYDAHCLFIKRKACSFLYTNMANNLYDRYVTDRVMSGEYTDYPHTCNDAAMEFYCDSYRRESNQSYSDRAQSGRSGNKPWSGYPYPFCYFWNEHNCCKKNCNLRHECGFCHTQDHKSKDCKKSSWKGLPLRQEPSKSPSKLSDDL